MNTTRELFTLQGLSGDLESAETFVEIYERALDRAKKAKDIEKIKALKKILMPQIVFVLSQYLKEEARILECEKAAGIQ